ncbi:hypothetical protein ACHAXA_007840 [Cyclostephanos tholiformis]|uniref:Uncharacterized protein n=1 Tax=Cyclostephanos tholiformis TaxID=382380 RepID=A0ABD3SBY9_9STRA
MNFMFSVAILLGLEKSGIPIGPTATINEPENQLAAIRVKLMDAPSRKLVECDESVQKSIDSWCRFFRGGYSNYKAAMLSSKNSNYNSGPFDRESERFQLQKEIWKAHVEVIQNNRGNKRSEELLTHMPHAERDFGQGWARMVEILAACVFPTDLVTLTYDGAGFLPTEVLTDECWADLTSRDKSKQLTGPQKYRFASVLATHNLVKMPAPMLRMIVLFWGRVVRTHQTSRTMPATVVKLVHGSSLVKLGQALRVLGLFLQPRWWGRIKMRLAETFAHHGV